MPTSDEATRLALPSGTPVLLIRRTAVTRDGGAVEADEMVLDAHSRILEYGFGA